MFDNDTITINKDCFVGCMKDLYCPKKFDPDTLSFDQVRALTIGKKSSVSITGQTTKDPKRWLPPESAIRRLADIVQLQIICWLQVFMRKSFQTSVPDFLGKGCLVKKDGHIEYDFWPDAHFSSVET